MKKVVRFGVSIETQLLAAFDRVIATHKYENRSQAIADLMRAKLVEKDWQTHHGDVTAIISLVYDHHRRELVNKLMDIQHDFQKLIISTQHIHLDPDHCLEIIAAKGNARSIMQLAHSLRAVKGVKHSALTATTSGKHLA